MGYEYDEGNIFAKILRGEIPCRKVAESELSLAFHDIAPQAPTHVLVIPKGKYVDYAHFAAEASEAEIADFTRLVGRVASEMGHVPGEGGSGFRILANAGPDSHQEVPHLHIHVFGGGLLGRMLDMPDRD